MKNMKKITFRHRPEEAFITPAVPASKALPEWYKKAKVDIDTERPWETTFKGCTPFLDAMTQGYIIPLWADLYVHVRPNAQSGKPEPIFTWGENMPEPLIQVHGPSQTVGLPAIEKTMADTAFKFVSPWVIQTSLGYSSLLVAPLNNAHPYFQMFSAVVATDQYFNNIHFPFAYTGPDDWQGTIPMGTPIMQVIPFKRDDFEHQVILLNKSNENIIASTRTAVAMGFRNTYTRLWRRPTKSI